MKTIISAFKLTFRQAVYAALAVSVTVNVLAVYLWIFGKTTTWLVFWESNIALYNWLAIILSIINAVLIGIAIAFFFHVLAVRKKGQQASFFETFGSVVFSAAATGCPVCGAFLLPLLGIAASLTALPFGGLEVKLLSILVLLYAIYEYARTITGVCAVPKERLISLTKGRLYLTLNKNTVGQLKPLGIVVAFIVFVYALPYLPKSWRVNFSKKSSMPVKLSSSSLPVTKSSVPFEKINPPSGYEIRTRFGDVGPKMLSMGVINLKKFSDVYSQANQPLTQEELAILTKGSDEKIRITPENSYFLLNFFWAFGLANKSPILEKGDMVKYGNGQVGNFASTGGWTLGNDENAMTYYSKSALVSLTPDQEALVNRVASVTYRPCCVNSTAFPDCNHGMAMLGLLELMASQGATEDELFAAAKYVNSYWFPSTALDVALYFKNKEGIDFENIDPKVYVSRDVFSAYGATNIKKWLVDNGIQEKPPATGGGCGV